MGLVMSTGMQLASHNVFYKCIIRNILCIHIIDFSLGEVSQYPGVMICSFVFKKTSKFYQRRARFLA